MVRGRALIGNCATGRYMYSGNSNHFLAQGGARGANVYLSASRLC